MASGRRAARSPWQLRDDAARSLGQVRRVIAEQAVEGELPDAELVSAYREVLERFELAHAEWLVSRQPATAQA